MFYCTRLTDTRPAYQIKMLSRQFLLLLLLLLVVVVVVVVSQKREKTNKRLFGCCSYIMAFRKRPTVFTPSVWTGEPEQIVKTLIRLSWMISVHIIFRQVVK